MEWKEILALIGTCLPIATFITWFVLIFVKKLKEPRKDKIKAVQEALSEASEMNATMFTLLNDIVPAAIETAEKSGMPNGVTKKVFCVSQVIQECAKRGIEYTEYADKINEMVEGLISFSKQVNTKK